MAVSTALFAAATGASRLVGMLREAAAAWIFSVQGEAINAFTVAYQIPNLIRSLVADAALGAAFVPIFNELLTKGERERAWRVASTVWWLSFAGLSVVTGIAMVLAPQLLALFGYHGSLGVGLARVIFPTVVHARPGRAADRDPERARRVLPARDRARRLEHRDRRHARAEPAVPAHDRPAPLRLRVRHPARHGRAARDPVSRRCGASARSRGSATRATRPCSACSR